MANLTAANVIHRKTRTGVVVLAVALSVSAPMVLVGLADGTLLSIAGRLESVGAHVLFQPPDASLILGVTSAVMPFRLMDMIREVPGVVEVAPVLNWHVSQLRGDPESLNLWAIEPRSFASVSGGLDLVAGHGLRDPGDLVIDSILSQQRGIGLGARVEMLDREFRVVGISRPGSGGRIFARIDDIGAAIGTPGRASFFLIRGRSANAAGALTQALQARFHGYKITAIAQVSQAIQRNATGLREFKAALASVAVVLSTLVVLLAMYTAILERTREIGILRALGATRGFVVRAILAETFLVACAGVLLGFGQAAMGRWALERFFPAESVAFTLHWAAIAAGLGLLGAVLGALYPAARAAALDPVEALNFE